MAESGLALRTPYTVLATIWLAGTGGALIGVFVDSTRHSTTRHSLHVAVRAAAIVLPIGMLVGWLLATWMWSRLFPHIASATQLDEAKHKPAWHWGATLLISAFGVSVTGGVFLLGYVVGNDPTSTTSWLFYVASTLAMTGAWQADTARRILAVERRLHVSYYWLRGRGTVIVPAQPRNPVNRTPG